MMKVIKYLTACAILVAAFGPGALARADSHTVVGNTMHLEVSDIDATRTGTLTLIKRVGERPRPVPGAFFSIKRIKNVDLGTEQGWAAARTMSVAEAVGETKDLIDAATTDAAGEARFFELPVGLYLVTEEDRGASPWNVQPFLLTIPSGSVDGHAWEYDVRVAVKIDVDSSSSSGAPSGPGYPPQSHEAAGGGAGADGADGADAARRQQLAYTGVRIFGVLAVGAGLVLAGVILRRRAGQAR